MVSSKMCYIAYELLASVTRVKTFYSFRQSCDNTNTDEQAGWLWWDNGLVLICKENGRAKKLNRAD